MDGRKVDSEQLSRKRFKGSLLSFGFTHEPHEHVVLYLCITIASMLSEVDRRTGLSPQSSRSSSIFAKRSSTMGLMNSISCRICDGMLDTKRATTLVLCL